MKTKATVTLKGIPLRVECEVFPAWEDRIIEDCVFDQVLVSTEKKGLRACSLRVELAICEQMMEPEGIAAMYQAAEIERQGDLCEEAYVRAEAERTFAPVLAFMKVGEVLCETPEEKNKWKKRMLGTVPGLSFPDDFDSLSEDEKARRLDGAAEIMKGG